MMAILIILFIIECGAFCYLLYEILEMKKEIETLYDNYAEQLERITTENLKLRKGVSKWFGQ